MLSTIAAAAASMAEFAADKTDYPNGTVRMVVPFAPGGASEHVARIIQPNIETE